MNSFEKIRNAYEDNETFRADLVKLVLRFYAIIGTKPKSSLNLNGLAAQMVDEFLEDNLQDLEDGKEN